MKAKWIIQTWGFAMLVSAGVAFAEIRYTITELGTLGQESSSGRAINNAGQVLGTARSENGQRIHFLWDPATGMRDLSSELGEEYWVDGFNDSGQFVLLTYGDADTDDRAFLWDGAAEPEYLGAFGPWTVNGRGRVLGSVWTNGPHTLIWDTPGGLRDIGSLPGGWWAQGRDLNDAGQVVGSANTDIPAIGHPIGHSMINTTVQHHAFLWDEPHGMQDLGTLGGDFCWGTGINDSGQVVGTSYTGDGAEVHAFLWDNVDGMRDLGTLPGHEWSGGIAINHAGQVIGESGSSDWEQDPTYFVWDSVNGIQAIDDLVPGDPGWTYFAARDLNDAGQIAGSGVTVTWVYDPYLHADVPHQHSRAVLLTPIPEPGVLLLLAFGAVVAVRRLSRKAQS